MLSYAKAACASRYAVLTAVEVFSLTLLYTCRSTCPRALTDVFPVLRDATHYSMSAPPVDMVAQELFCGCYVASAWSARIDALLYGCRKVSAEYTYAAVLSI